jgi:hypothetical protein
VTTLTARSKWLLEGDGYKVAIVEHYNGFTKRKHDLFGCIDILAIGAGETIAVQVTSKSNMSSRRHKIQDSDAYPEMVRAGWRVQIHGWHKEGNRWQCKVEELC